ncbi:AGGF1 factor, partial [Amia calva]|nr:AGGF1 factor [Amia calva]
MTTNGEEGSERELRELSLKVETLEQELKSCKSELYKLQKQLNKTERLYKNTESYNDDLRKQVDKLSKEIHDRKKREKNRTEAETQTGTSSSWNESDYYYYYGPYYQSGNEGTESNPVTKKDSESDVQQNHGTVATDDDVMGNASEQERKGTAAVPEESDGTSIADILRATAEEAVSQTGFVFDEYSGMYYDHSTGFYYDSTSQLYYDANTGIYYYYDADSGRYQFHSRVDVQAVQPDSDPSQEKKAKKRRKGNERAAAPDDQVVDGKMLEQKRKRTGLLHRAGAEGHRSESHSPNCVEDEDVAMTGDMRRGLQRCHSHDTESESEPEEGELTESEREEGSSEEWTASESSDPSDHQEEQAWPPCVRVTVVRSPVLQTGTLFIITADTPATIGREKDMEHAIRIPEIGVSKFHAEVYFDHDLQSYVLVDQGSQNGTVINGNRILQPKAKCDPYTLAHGDEIKMGETVLSFHIHSGNDTCDGCEPGQVLAHLSRNKKAELSGSVLSKEDKEALRQKELKQMKVKYGLKSSDYEAATALKNSKYKDRAEKRRQKVGSEGTFQRDDAPASVNVEISDGNKGRKMLEKMGWKKGEGLGKDKAGRKDPIQLEMRKAQAGLGVSAPLSVEDGTLLKTKNQKNWDKARERFADTCQTKKSTKKKDNPKAKSWVKSEDR